MTVLKVLVSLNPAHHVANPGEHKLPIGLGLFLYIQPGKVIKNVFNLIRYRK